jgi:hypothetical protein
MDCLLRLPRIRLLLKGKGSLLLERVMFPKDILLSLPRKSSPRLLRSIILMVFDEKWVVKDRANGQLP